MVMRHANLDWYNPSFKTPLYPLVPIIGLLGCLFVMSITSRPTIMIGLAIVTGSLIWYTLFLRKQTQLEGATNLLWQEKVVVRLVAKAEDYAASRRGTFPVILVPLSNANKAHDDVFHRISSLNRFLSAITIDISHIRGWRR